jgi:DNA-binding MarR family transcriptional regulator
VFRALFAVIFAPETNAYGFSGMKDYDELLVSLRRITRAIDMHSKRLQKETGLTTSQQLILESISKQETPTPSCIARDIHLSQATVTSIVIRLEKNGLVHRSKGTADRRSTILSLTELGSAKLKDAPELLQAEFLKSFRTLESWEQHMLVSAMQRVATLMDAGQIDASPILTTGDVRVDD